MGAESQISGFTESQKSLKNSLPHCQKLPADLAITAQFGETHPAPKCLVWGDSNVGTLPNLGRRTSVVIPMPTTEESEGAGPRTHEMSGAHFGGTAQLGETGPPTLKRRIAHLRETGPPTLKRHSAHFGETQKGMRRPNLLAFSEACQIRQITRQDLHLVIDKINVSVR